MQRHRDDKPIPERILVKESRRNFGTRRSYERYLAEYRYQHLLLLLEQMEGRLMATIQEILDDETTETADLATLVTVVGALNQNVVDLQALVAELQANAGGLTPEQQASLDAINAAQDANDATIKSLLPPASS